ncbi:MAG: response regulator [Opitutae bacterium]|nr:response regulator [Opitutae bacterium]
MNTLLVMWLIFAAACEAGLALLVCRRLNTTGGLLFALGFLINALWCLTFAFDLWLTDSNTKILLLQIRYAFLPFSTLIWLEGCCRFSTGKAFLFGWRLMLATAPAVFTVILTWAGPDFGFHPWFRHSFIANPDAEIPFLRYSAGPWNYCYYAINYAILCISIVILLRNRNDTTWKRTSHLLMAGTLAAASMTDMLGVLGFTRPSGIAYTPLAFPLFSGTIAWALLRKSVIDLTPVARAMLIESLPDILIVMNAARVVIDMNKSAREALGICKVSEYYLQPAVQVLGNWPELLSCYKSRVTKADIFHGQESFEYLSTPVLTGRENEPSATILQVRNVTMRVRYERELAYAKHVAEGANEAQKRFLAIMSHEIRTPMNAVLGFAHLLRETPLELHQKQYIDSLSQYSQALLVVIDDLLDYTKITTGRLVLEEVAFDISQLVGDLCRVLSPLAKQKGLVFRYDVAVGTPMLLLGDPVRIGQIITNLAGNALKFTHKGEVVLQVSYSAPPDASPGTLTITVQDSGIGLSKTELAGLFRPYTQANSSIHRAYGGSGLGLSIVKGLCELMNGSVTVNSEQGQGALFTAVVKIARAQCTNLHPEVLTHPCRIPPLNILVFEDDRGIQDLLRAILEQDEHRVCFVTHSLAGLSILNRENFDVILLDIFMPGLDGIETARQIRELPIANANKPYIIGLTGCQEPSLKTKCLAAGMDDFLLKPVGVVTLRMALMRACPRARGRLSAAKDNLASRTPCLFLQSPKGGCTLISIASKSN